MVTKLKQSCSSEVKDFAGKKFSIFAWIFIILVFCTNTQAMDYENYLYQEGFESTNPVTFWCSNGTYTVNQAGITTAEAYSGTHSYVIDLTMNSGSYYYWRIMLPANVPCENILKFSARIKVEQISGTTSSAGLGNNAYSPPTNYSQCPCYKWYSTTNGQWELIEVDVVNAFMSLSDIIKKNIWGATRNNAGLSIDRIGFYIKNSNVTAGDRIRIYIDDIKLEGNVPTAASYATEVASRWALYATKFNSIMSDFNAKYSAAQTAVNNLPGDLSAFEQNLEAKAQQQLDDIYDDYNLTTIGNRGWIYNSEYNPVKYKLSQAAGIADNISLARSSAITREDHLLYNISPTEKTIQSVLPDANFIYGYINNNIDITATPGEYESASFAVEAFDDLNDLSVAVTNLSRTGGGTISSSDIDIRVVKCWYQSGIDSINYTYSKFLIPELLLKDDSLISVDYTNQENYAKISGNYVWISDPTKQSSGCYPTNAEFPIADSQSLQPVDISDSKFKQFWLTVKVPDDAAGEYSGYITLTTTGEGEIGRYPIKVNVLPFRLEDSPLKYNIYYGGRLKSDGTGTISSVYKTTQQYTAEISNMLSHGINNTDVAQHYTNPTLIDNELTIRDSLGMNQGVLYFEGLSTGNSTDPTELATLKSNVEAILDIADDYGISDVYIYGLDEANDDELLKQREAWEAVHEAGGKIFVAGGVGDLTLEYPWGKIGNWHFDEASGTVAGDSSGSNDGTLTNMNPLNCWVTGKVGNALSFDGVNDGVNMGDIFDLGTSDRSISLWFKTSDTTAVSRCILSKGYSTTSNQHSIYLLPSGGLYIIMDITGTDRIVHSGGTQVNDGQWHHVVLTIDRDDTMKLYLDGELTSTTDISMDVSVDAQNNYSFYVGRSHIGQYFPGLIDEVKVFSRVLSGNEIEKEYYYGDQGTRQVVGDLKDLHICAYALNADEADECHEVTGHEIFSYANPQIGVEDPEIYRRNYGIQLWRYGYDGAMDFAYQWTFGHIWNDFDHSMYREHNFTYPTTNGIIDTIAWEGFREGVDDTRYLATLLKAVDEAPASQAKDDAADFIDSLQDTDRLDIDNLVELREEIISHILKLCGPGGNWHFDEVSGTVASDSSGSNDGTLTNMNPATCWVSGKIGNALSFDGVNDGVNMGDILDLGTGDRSISLWFKTSDTTAVSRCILSKGYSTTSNQHSIYLLPSGGLYIIMDITGTDRIVHSGGTQVNDGQWHHVVLTIDRDDTMKLYLDGELTSTTDISMDVSVDAQNNYSFYVGRSHAGQYFPGLIDEVKVFPRVLNEDEIERECQGWN